MQCNAGTMNTVEVGGMRQITMLYVRSVWFYIDVAVLVVGLVVDAHGADQGLPVINGGHRA